MQLFTGFELDAKRSKLLEFTNVMVFCDFYT